MKIQRSARILKCVPLAVALLVLTVAEAPADILRFTHTGTGSGTLDGGAFLASDFVITALADTDDRQSFAGGWWIDHLSASISIDGLGNFDLLSPTRHFVNNGVAIVGFSRGGRNADLFNGPTDPEFGAWDMLGPIGPIAGTGSLLQWAGTPQINTTGGILIFDDGPSDTTFTVVPEPGTLAIFAVGGMGLMARRRRTPRGAVPNRTAA